MWLLCALTQLRGLIKSDLNPELKFHVSFVRWGVVWDGIYPREDGHGPISSLKMSDQTRFISCSIPFYLMLCRFYSKILTALLLNSSWYLLLYFSVSCPVQLVQFCRSDLSAYCYSLPHCCCCVLWSQYLVNPAVKLFVSFGSCHVSHSILWRYVDFRCSLYSH